MEANKLYGVIGVVIGATLGYFFGVGGILGLLMVLPLGLIRDVRRREARKMLEEETSSLSKINVDIGNLERLSGMLSKLLQTQGEKDDINLRDIKNRYKNLLNEYHIQLPNEATPEAIEELIREIRNIIEKLKIFKEGHEQTHRDALKRFFGRN